MRNPTFLKYSAIRQKRAKQSSLLPSHYLKNLNFTLREVFDSWSEIKKFHLDALIKVYTTEELFMKNAAVNKGMIVVSKTKTINREDVDALPTILQSLRENLLDEMKEKAFKENAQAIVGLKIEIHSVFEGILNMVLYGTLASY